MTWLWFAGGLLVGINIGFALGAIWNGMIRGQQRIDRAGD